MAVSARRRIWGWFFFDWASQPFNTLLLTFIFGPYVKELLGAGTKAQAAWGYGIGAAGLVIAVLAPLLGAVADKAGGRRRFIWLFSAMYFLGSWGLWYAAPGDFNLFLIMLSFAIGLVGMEFATIFTNSMLPDLGTREEIGRISGSGWAFGYVGGLLALILMLGVFQINQATGRTMIGVPPLFGLDVAAQPALDQRLRLLPRDVVEARHAQRADLQWPGPVQFNGTVVTPTSTARAAAPGAGDLRVAV